HSHADQNPGAAKSYRSEAPGACGRKGYQTQQAATLPIGFTFGAAPGARFGFSGRRVPSR
ncbi:unnamed protein product, partial [Symbiodinium microadriaticum]